MVPHTEFPTCVNVCEEIDSTCLERCGFQSNHTDHIQVSPELKYLVHKPLSKGRYIVSNTVQCKEKILVPEISAERPAWHMHVTERDKVQGFKAMEQDTNQGEGIVTTLHLTPRPSTDFIFLFITEGGNPASQREETQLVGRFRHFY